MNSRSEHRTVTLPFLRWAGGKRWLTSRAFLQHAELTGNYFEPFLGSGAMFFHLRPKTSILSDANSALIETYQAIKSDYTKVTAELQEHALKHSAEYYYQVRSMDCGSE